MLCLLTAAVLFFVLDIRTAVTDLTGLGAKGRRRERKAGRARKRKVRQKKEGCFVPEREIVMIHTEQRWERILGEKEREKGSI